MDISDSDSDFESEGPFEAVDSDPPQPAPNQTRTNSSTRPVQTSGSNASSNSSNASTTNVQQELYQKMGENAILRSRLESIEKEHQKAINDIINHQNKVRDDQKHELEEYKKKLQRERIQYEFKIKELKAKGIVAGTSSNARPTNSPRSTSASASTAASSASTNRSEPVEIGRSARRKPESEAFSDGFVIKKPRLSTGTSPANTSTSSNISTGSTTAVEPLTASRSTSVSRPVELGDHHLLLPFLVAHKAPGFTEPTLQSLYHIPTHVEGSSMGRDFAVSTSRDELIIKISSHIESRAADFSTDITTLSSSLSFDLLFVKTQLTSKTEADAPRMLTDILSGWLQQLEPLPSLDDVGSLGSSRITHARLFSCISYGFDVLINVDWEFKSSVDSCRVAFAQQQAPHIYIRACDLIARHPSLPAASLSASQTPHYVIYDDRETPVLPHNLPDAVTPGGAVPTTEMIFGGLGEFGAHTVVEYAQRVPPESVYMRLVTRISDFEPLFSHAVRASQVFVVTTQCAWIRAAQANVDAPPDAKAARAGPRGLQTNDNDENSQFGKSEITDLHGTLDRGVLSSLSVALERAFPHKSPIVHLATEYFWCRSIDDSRECMTSPDLTESCLCSTKIVYANNNERNLVGQAQEILKDITSIEEVERSYDAFKPRDQWNEGDYTMEEADISMID